MWDDNETQDQTRTKGELNLNRDNLEDENSFFDDQPLTNNVWGLFYVLLYTITKISYQ